MELMEHYSPPVSVVMLGCDKAAYTRLALDALAQTDYPRLELVFVDNGSTDETPAVVDDFARQAADRHGGRWAVQRLNFPKNIGAVAGRNAALEITKGDFVAFLDNDVVVAQRSWLTRLLDRFARPDGKDLGILGPKILFAQPPHLIQCAGCEIHQSGRVVFRGRGEAAGDPAFDRPVDVPCLISATWLLRAELVRALGPLDRLFDPVQFEDIDYCCRARRAGWRVAYEPSVRVYHFENVTTDGGRATDNYLRLTIRNGLKFKRKWADLIEAEGRPDAAAPPWKAIDRVGWDAVGALPMED